MNTKTRFSGGCNVIRRRVPPRSVTALASIPENKEASLCRTVRKDNTIIYDSNRYSVPLGTYTSNPEVNVKIKGGTLYIQTIFGEAICEHRICTGKGRLIQNNNHLRDRTGSLDRMQAALDELLAGQAGEFLQMIRAEKSRYARDQFKLIQTLYDKYGLHCVLEAIGFCQNSRLYSANYLKDYLEHAVITFEKVNTPAIPLSNKKYHVTTEKRPLEVYVRAGAAR